MTHPAISIEAPEQAPERDRRLLRRLADERDPVDRSTVIERFLPLARHVAARYQRPGEPFEDLYQVACFGLVKAVDRYDAERGVAFSSYAVPTMTGEIKRHFRDRTWSVRVPRDLQDNALRVERALERLTASIGHAPTVDQIGDAVDLDTEAVLEALQARDARRATSLEAPHGRGHDDEPRVLGDTIGHADDGFDQAERRADLRALTRRLTARQRAVVHLRFEHDLTQAQIGSYLGLSQMQVSRDLRRAVDRLRALAADDEAGPRPLPPA
jgi:RNA polymerase sigma-B factor